LFPSNVGCSLSCLETLSFSRTLVFLGVSCIFADVEFNQVNIRIYL
jgi:hypothetical protein